jgi:hypothetical protein
MNRERGIFFAVALAAGCGTVTTEGPAPKTPEPPKAAAAPAKAPPKVAAPTTALSKAAPPVAARPTAPPLDLRTLEQRLKDTNAIGLLTKLSLKNQVDDLVGRFKAFHDGQRPPTINELRPAYELLLMKVLALLQDHDTKLANDINASRDAIWGVLTDRQKLAPYL